MTEIWKYRVEAGVPTRMKKGAAILSAGQQGRGNVVVWAEVEPEAETVDRLIDIWSTGNDILPHDPGEFIGTVQDSPFVWHLYDRGEVE